MSALHRVCVIHTGHAYMQVWLWLVVTPQLSLVSTMHPQQTLRFMLQTPNTFKMFSCACLWPYQGIPFIPMQCHASLKGTGRPLVDPQSIALILTRIITYILPETRIAIIGSTRNVHWQHADWVGV